MPRILCDDELAFLRTIHDNPADDLPRLVFADWLEETGDPMLTIRAQLIRSQILAAGGNHPESMQARAFGESILQTHTIEWWKELPEIDGVVWGWLERGFPAHAIVAREAWLRSYEAIFDLLPITSVRVGSIHLADLEELLDRGVPQNLRKLSVGDPRRVRYSERVDAGTGRSEYRRDPFESIDERVCLRSVQRMISVGLHRTLTDLTIDGLRHYSSEVQERLYEYFPPLVLRRSRR